MPCPVTGEDVCRCGTSKKGTPTLVSPKETLRKLFTDHAVYTKFFIEASLNDLPDTKVITTRLLKNQDDIGKYLGKFVGKEKGSMAASLLRDHILLAAECVEELKENDMKSLNVAIEKLMTNATKVGRFLHSLNPDKLPLEGITREFKQHNKYVLDMAVLHSKGKFKDEIETYDTYYTHMLMISDTLFGAL